MIEFADDGPVSVEDEVTDQLEGDAESAAEDRSLPDGFSVKSCDLLWALRPREGIAEGRNGCGDGRWS